MKYIYSADTQTDLSGLHSETLLLTLGLDQLNVTMPNTMASLISEHREKIYRSYFSQLTKMQVGTLKNVLKKSNVQNASPYYLNKTRR